MKISHRSVDNMFMNVQKFRQHQQMNPKKKLNYPEDRKDALLDYIRRRRRLNALYSPVPGPGDYKYDYLWDAIRLAVQLGIPESVICE